MCVLTLLTWRQSGIYNNATILYEATLQKNPGSWLAHYNLGNEFKREGRLQEAIDQYERAVRRSRIMPKH